MNPWISNLALNYCKEGNSSKLWVIKMVICGSENVSGTLNVELHSTKDTNDQIRELTLQWTFIAELLWSNLEVVQSILTVV